MKRAFPEEGTLARGVGSSDISFSKRLGFVGDERAGDNNIAERRVLYLSQFE